MKRKLVLGLFIALMVTSLAVAADEDRKGFYIGGGIGSSGVNVEGDDLVEDSNEEFDDNDTGWKVFAGYRFMKFFGLEGSFVDFGNPSGELGGIEGDIEVQAFNAQAVGYLPIGFVDLFAKAGYYRWDAEFNFENVDSDSDSDWDFNYGGGVGFNFGEHFAIQAEYERFEVTSGNLDLFSASALFRF